MQTHVLQPLDVGVFAPLDRHAPKSMTGLLLSLCMPHCFKETSSLCAKVLERKGLRLGTSVCMGGVRDPSLRPCPGDGQFRMAASFLSTSRIATATRQAWEKPPASPSSPTEMELLRPTTPNTLEEARSRIDALESAVLKLEADLAVAKAELHQAPTRQNPTKWSRAILSGSRYITQADLEGCTMHRNHHHLPQGRESPKTQQRKPHPNEAAQDDEELTKTV